MDRNGIFTEAEKKSFCCGCHFSLFFCFVFIIIYKLLLFYNIDRKRSMGNEHAAKFKRNIEADALQRAIKNLSPLENERLNEEAILQGMSQQIPVSST